MSSGPAEFDSARFATRYEQVRERLDRAAPDPSAVRIVAVTKGFGREAVDAALAAGLVDIGENYATELLGKVSALKGARPTVPPPPLRGVLAPAAGRLRPTWHFLGAVQRNKIARLAPVVDWWQAVSRLEEARSIALRCPAARMLVQVNVSGGTGRGGCDHRAVPLLVSQLRDAGIEPGGLMTVAPLGPPERARVGFVLVSKLADSLNLPIRSFGMTDDLDVALSEGSTMVRLGRALFGDRPHKTSSGGVHQPPG
ncbi:MAG: alanine racemase [Acidimicrobiales bacterium]